MTDKAAIRILLVDDEEHLLVTLGDYLSFEGFEVSTASRAEEALHNVEAAPPDLVVLDISMPGMSAADFVRALSRRPPPRIPVLVFSAVSDMKKGFGELRIDGYVAKPCSEAELVRRIHGILSASGRKDGESGPPHYVLLVDPDPARAAPICDAILQAGCCVDRATNGSDALAQTFIRQSELIIMSDHVGDMEARTILSLLHDMPTTRRIPVLIYGVTDSATRDSVLKYVETGTLLTLETTDAATITQCACKLMLH